MCTNLNAFWTFQTKCLSTDQLINSVYALKFLHCKTDDFLSICGSSCMPFVKEIEGILKNHSGHNIQRRPVHAQCLGLAGVWQPAWSYCSALAAKYLEVSTKM